LDIKDICEKYDKILILPERNIEDNSTFVSAFEQVLSEKDLRGIVLTTAPLNRNTAFMVISIEEMQKILRLYQLYKFTDKLIIGSFTKPHGRMWGNLVTSGLIKKEPLIKALLNTSE